MNDVRIDGSFPSWGHYIRAGSPLSKIAALVYTRWHGLPIPASVGSDTALVAAAAASS